MADINERRYWDRYQELYSEMISATSTEEAPWYIVPADNNGTPATWSPRSSYGH